MAIDPSDSACARVFISCGQAKGSDEVHIATEIARRLEELGFEPYIAVQEQSLRGLKENIFARLENSEYFVFVDFKREQLARDPPVCRGSLFSHQELALASYLGLEVIAFQENGVKQDDGILRFLQGNATQFSDRHLLPGAIADEVRRRCWDHKWRNELVLERPDPSQYVDSRVRGVGDSELGRFFHIDVRNRHRRKIARNCYAYLESAFRLDPLTPIPLRAAEIKWEGYSLPNAHIPPGTARRFDGFYVLHFDPSRLRFQVFTDSTAFIPRIEGEGRYELHYAVVADNFSTARGSFLLSLNPSLDTTTLASVTSNSRQVDD